MYRFHEHLPRINTAGIDVTRRNTDAIPGCKTLCYNQ